jgi:uncharacterized protein RhaS with RHS repeats
LYMQQRYYEPLAGRFLSVDPVVTNANNGNSFNRYRYANNSPYRFTDPDGRNPDSCGKGAMFCYSTYFSESGGSVQSPQKASASTSSQAAVPPAAAAGAPGGPLAGGPVTSADVNALSSIAIAATPLGRGVQATITLYRAVTQAELKQIQLTGKFEAGANSLGGKWFAESASHARQWGNAMNGKGESTILEVQLPRGQADQLMRLEKLDGIGPARYGELGQLHDAVIKAIGP